MSRLLPLVFLLQILLWSPIALAASLRTDVSARNVVVGERVRVRITVILEDGDSRPQARGLPVKGDATVSGPASGPHQAVYMRGSQIRREQGYVFSWNITPNKAGDLVVGPAVFLVSGKQVVSETIVVHVSEEQATQRNQRSQRRRLLGRDRFGRDRFGGKDPFDDPFFDSFPGLRRPRRPALPQAPTALVPRAAPDPIGFLIARVNKSRVVLGEALTLEVYAYGSRGPYRELSPVEPSTANFLSYQVVETSHDQPRMLASIDGQDFVVLKLREIILVPLETGQLTIGAMKAALAGTQQQYPKRGSRIGTLVQSSPLTVQVDAAPADGRPADYIPGTVGRFRVTSQLTPRQLEQGQYLELRLKISGQGNLPDSVSLPEVPGIVWGKPTSAANTSVDGEGLGGDRTLVYTAKATRVGDFELGELRLPYFDPKRKRYAVAREALGELSVDPATHLPAPTGSSAAPAAPAASSTSSPFLPRSSLGPSQAAPSPPPTWLFWLSALLPLLGAALALLPRAFSHSQSALNARSARSGGASLKDAKKAAAAGDVSEALRETERVLFSAIHHSCGVKARGVLREHLSGELQAAGLEASRANEAERIALELERLRYEAPSDARSARSAVEELLSSTEALVHALGRRKSSKKRRASLASTALLGMSLLASSVIPQVAQAAEESAQVGQALQGAATALEEEKHSRAIALLEEEADRGHQHPDLSFNRGVAYLRRAATPGAQPGDLGQAAAAFQEALLQRPDDAEAARGLDEARLQVARRVSNRSQSPVDAISLDRRVLARVSPWLLSLLALFFSLAATGGVVVHLRASGLRRRAGTITVGIASVLLLSVLGLQVARDVALDGVSVAIVISRRAPVLDESGKALKGATPLPEGTELLSRTSRGELVEVQLSGHTAWLRRSQLRLLKLAP